MRPEIRRLTNEQFASLLGAVHPQLTRQITAVHLHHTWRPTRSQFKGLATVEAMRNFHVNTNGWSDIAQHLTIDPQGFSWTGRNWNLPPASQAGRNGTREQGPFMIEIVGDFDIGRDLLDGAQRQAVVQVVASILHVCDIRTGDIHFHRELGSPKTCPGTGVDKAVLLAEIEGAIGRLGGRAAEGRPRGGARAKARGGAGAAARRELPFGGTFVLGHDVAARVDEPDAHGYERWEVQEHDLAAEAIHAGARARVRATLGETRDFPSALERTKSEWEVLRPHVVNLTQGLLSQGGEFDMPPGAIDGIVDAIGRYAVTVEKPRVMLHAHGGLVGEKTALAYARRAHQWWLDHGVFPIYFVWETSAFEVIRNRLGLGRGIGDWWDRRFESFARPIGKPLWGDMKEYALLSSSTDAGEGQAGGAWIFAQALSKLVANPPNGTPISLHAVGHSAGAIFHAHFIPALVAAGMSVDSLAFLAPAVRIDLFKQQLLPLIASKKINRFEMYTMDDEAERDDDLIEALGVPVYGKSLLYLVSGAFEPEQDAPILGLQARFPQDPEVAALFPPNGPHRVEFSHAKGKPHNPATRSRRHGCFDNDDATIRSVLATITGESADEPFAASDESCEKASSRALATGWAIGSPAPGTASPGFFPGVITSERGSSTSGGRALCVGIDSYPTSPLAGCVRDAHAWARVLRELSFDVTTVIDREATRQRVLDALRRLVTSARAGEMLVFQYAGHGTQADDLNGDEGDRYDEALVPIDYASGALLLDDDLADVYRSLPEGATLTLFMDCCHSGTNSRFAPLDRSTPRGDERRRFLELTPDLQAAHRQFRAKAGSPQPTTAEESLPGVIHFAACLDNQYAYESAGQGHFTRVATGALAAAVARGTTNEAFGNDVAAQVIAIGRPQTPRLMRLPAGLADRALLAGSAGGGAAGTGATTGGPGTVVPGGTAAPWSDRTMDEWWLQFFEMGAAHWRQRLGR
jgi:hypothetical protein